MNSKYGFNKIILIVVPAFLLLMACNKDLLDTVPNDRISTTIFWKSENDAKLALNAIYPLLDATNIFAWDGVTDIGHTNQTFEFDAFVEQGVYDALNRRISTEWSSAYSGIRASNYFLENVDKVPSTNMVLINQLKGEAKALRAYQYIKLAGLYGDVPLVTTTIGIDEGQTIPRTPVADIWNFIDAELTAASSLLPVSYGVADKGRVTKGAALALKARSNLFAGRYQQALDAARQVIDLNVYAIYPQYANLFYYAAENNTEIIFDKQFIKDTYSNGVFDLMGPYSLKNSLNFYVPTKVLADAYPMNNGKYISDVTSGFDPFNPYNNRDPRMRFSLFLPGDVLANGQTFNPLPNSGTPDAVGNTFLATSTGYVLKKYINNEDFANPRNSGINIILLRYAEVFLTYAEAKIELNQIDQSVFDAINKVRQRGDVNLPALSNSLSQNQLRDAVRRERMIELAFEGLRLFDMRRWKIAENVIPGPVYGITYVSGGQLTTIKVQGFDKVFDKNRHYLWPIPQKERELNSNLTQNNGW